MYEEGLLHLFLYCQKFEVFMRRIKNIVKSMFRDKYDKDMTEKTCEFFFLFGLHGKECNVMVCNLLVTIAKHTTCLRRNSKILKQFCVKLMCGFCLKAKCNLL